MHITSYIDQIIPFLAYIFVYITLCKKLHLRYGFNFFINIAKQKNRILKILQYWYNLLLLMSYIYYKK